MRRPLWRLSILPTSQQDNIDNGTTLGTVKPNTAAAPSWRGGTSATYTTTTWILVYNHSQKAVATLGYGGNTPIKRCNREGRVTTKQQSIDGVRAINELIDDRSKVINQRCTKRCDILCFCNYAVLTRMWACNSCFFTTAHLLWASATFTTAQSWNNL